MSYAYFWLIILSSLAVYFDLRYGKIPNALIIVGIIFAVIKIILNYNDRGILLDCILGFIFPITVLFILFRIRVLGAGDVKLIAVIGFTLGLAAIQRIMIYSFYIAGIYSIVILIIYKDAYQRLKRLFRYFSNCVKTGHISSYSIYNSVSAKQLYYSIAILGGLIFSYIRTVI